MESDFIGLCNACYNGSFLMVIPWELIKGQAKSPMCNAKRSE